MKEYDENLNNNNNNNNPNKMEISCLADEELKVRVTNTLTKLGKRINELIVGRISKQRDRKYKKVLNKVTELKNTITELNDILWELFKKQNR